ncbi:fibrous sheath-interacting protein 2 isoform X8 [Bubalus bubalis]|uniref:fibrous sheath-interacting protein 2 isoform X8 n=1 Tax=Bubalus bubalis TaxID=89462 RepID=UPI001E1B95CC|nr:fibrous sheath-interacting protein 2 isoform X8 [Bubalus bubalis]
MDRYLNNCYKAAQAAASKEAASSLTANRELCDSASGGQSGTHKDPIPEVGAAKLLDLPLSVKLPVIPGSNVFYTTNLSEKLYQPSYDFNLSDPYCQLLETGYKNLHHPHLKSYYRGKDIPRRLKKGGYVTSNNKVLCTLNKLNKYRQYLTSLKLDFERNYVREQKMIEKQVNKLYETKRACDSHGSTQFQDLLLQENKQTTPDQELLIKQRYLDMISLELNKLEHMAEKQNVLWIKEEERLHRDHIRRKLSLRRQIEEKWKTNEMLLLSKIGEEVKRESRLEEQRKKVKEDAHRKKKAQLKKKITYHLPKMQRNDLQREGSEENVFENRSQDETEGERETIKDKASYPKIKKMSVTAGHQKSHQGQKRPSQHLYSSVKTPERRSTLLHSPHDVKSNTTEQKKDRETIRTSYPSNDGEITTLQSPGVSAKTPSICRYCLQDTSKQQVTRADLNGEKAKKSSLNYEPAPGVSFIHDSPIRQDYHPNRCQEKETEMRPSTEPTHHFIHRMMSASSYTEEDLASFSSFDDDHSTDPSAKVIEESLECPCLENLSSLEFLTLYQHRSDRTSQYSSNDGTSDFEKPHTSSRQRSEVFSRSNTSVRKPSSPSPPHQERK